MFNSHSSVRGGDVSNSLQINAVSGTLVKNHKKSRFVYASTQSTIFDEMNPRIRFTDGYFWKEKEVVVLQAMIAGEGVFLCEIVMKEDF